MPLVVVDVDGVSKSFPVVVQKLAQLVNITRFRFSKDALIVDAHHCYTAFELIREI